MSDFEKHLDKIIENLEFIKNLDVALTEEGKGSEFITRKELAKAFDLILRIIEKNMIENDSY